MQFREQANALGLGRVVDDRGVERLPDAIHRKLLVRLAQQAYLGAHRRGGATVPILDELDEQALLGPEIIEQARARKSAAVGEILDTETIVSASSDEIRRLPENLLAANVSIEPCSRLLLSLSDHSSTRPRDAGLRRAEV